MMNMLTRGAFAFALLCLVSCQANTEPEATTSEEPVIVQQESADSTAGSEVVPAQRTTFEMLQGKWRHIEDTTNFLIFENGIRKEIAAGMEEWDEEPFVLADKCQNESDKGREQEERVRYLSTPESDLCWLIDEVSETSLVLLYLGRGNILIYTRVNG